MSIILFLRVLWKRLSLSLYSGSLRIDGLWDRKRLRSEATENLRDWKNALLLHPRRDALRNGVVVAKVEHLKDDSDKSWQHEFLRIQVLHEKSKEKLTLIVDRDVWPKDTRSPPERNEAIEHPETDNNTTRPSKHRNNRNVKAPEPKDEIPNDLDLVSHKRDVPEEKGLSLIVTRISGVVHCSEPFFSGHRVLDRVHRGVEDLEKRLISKAILELQTLTFPECSRPSIIDVAFLLSAVSEFAPQYHIGEYQAYWFAHATLDSLHATFRGKLRPGTNIHAMGKWDDASFKYVNPAASVGAEYIRQVREYEEAFKVIQSAGRRFESYQAVMEDQRTASRTDSLEDRQEQVEHSDERREVVHDIETEHTVREPRPFLDLKFPSSGVTSLRGNI
ncbi:hypothetical protein R3P38DRAFT_2819977 [Favolaschia claudopus]|uniref:Uncharacterized protein n=1 Tax=Favolaschia claudopus TaxID=2862362 RepID=A0AAW0EDJ2_9AGAR